MAKLCIGAFFVYQSTAVITEDVEGLGLLQVQAAKKRDDPVHEWGFPQAEEGWYDSGPETSCATACGSQGLICTEQATFAHFGDVDTNDKVLNMIAAVGGRTSDTSCRALDKAPMPNWNANKCFRGSSPRLLTHERCTAIPGPQGAGKHRLCYCHPEVPATTTEPPRMCCRAFSPTCLACSAGLTVEEWCDANENHEVASMCPETAVAAVEPAPGTCEPCSVLHGTACTHPGNADAAWCENNCVLAHQSDEACGVDGITGSHCVCSLIEVTEPPTRPPTTTPPIAETLIATEPPTRPPKTTQPPVVTQPPMTMPDFWATTTRPQTTTVADDAEAVEDPHMSSIHGNKFDLYQPGHHVLLAVPRGASEQDAQLYVSAEISKIGVRDNDLWIRKLDIQGAWVGDHLTFETADGDFNAPETQLVRKGNNDYSTAELVAQQHPTFEVLTANQAPVAPTQEFEHAFTKRMRVHMGPVLAKIKFGTAFKNGQQINHIDFRAEGLTTIKEEIGGELADEASAASLLEFSE